MFRKDKFMYGLLVGLLLPALAWCYEYLTAQETDQKRIIFLFSIALNLLVVRLCYKRAVYKTANGIMFITFLAALGLFYSKTLL